MTKLLSLLIAITITGSMTKTCLAVEPQAAKDLFEYLAGNPA
ncbi:MAG TPA: hypothetical protein VN249_06590 [Prolixibacteraceae bacterium]|nr:hypothetical protein [Prolixibacteraceae bacterium]